MTCLALAVCTLPKRSFPGSAHIDDHSRDVQIPVHPKWDSKINQTARLPQIAVLTHPSPDTNLIVESFILSAPFAEELELSGVFNLSPPVTLQTTMSEEVVGTGSPSVLT